MKKSLIYIFTLIIFCASAYASDSAVKNWGIGISFARDLFFQDTGNKIQAYSPVAFYIPINLHKSIRLEPELGVYTTNELVESPSYSSETSYSAIKAGLGILYSMDFKKVVPYIGLRFGMIFLSESNNSGSSETTLVEETRTLTNFASCFGGEYYFSDNFSLGLEIQLNYTIYGDVANTPEQEPETMINEYSLSTGAHIFARLFFN